MGDPIESQRLDMLIVINDYFFISITRDPVKTGPQQVIMKYALIGDIYDPILLTCQEQ
jgi:hypothetical protein